VGPTQPLTQWIPETDHSNLEPRLLRMYPRTIGGSFVLEAVHLKDGDGNFSHNFYGGGSEMSL
jgi:hypothetical protein